MVSVRCSDPQKCRLKERFYGAVAIAFCAAALFCNAVPCAGEISVEGVPAWIETDVLRGLSAVWKETPAEDEGLRLETLLLVARRLFSGYDLTAKDLTDGPHLIFKPRGPVVWSVELVRPDLRSPVSAWFERDIGGVTEEIASLLEGLPEEALSWMDSALRDRIGTLVERCLPGWDFSLLVRLDSGEGILQLSFRPRQPLVLAVTPSIYSSTLPVMLQSDLTAKLIPGLSSIIGLPVGWIAEHRKDVERLAQDFLEDRNAVSNTRSRVEVSFHSDQVSKLDASVNSERLIFQVWLAAYAGIEGRYPEAGVLLGWNTRHLTGVDLELYGEVIVDMSEFGMTNRLGARFALGRAFRLGVEVEWPEQEVWYRMWWDAQRLQRPYAWWRYSPELGHNAAIGYRINEHISVEIHYDGRYDDKIGLRGILLL